MLKFKTFPAGIAATLALLATAGPGLAQPQTAPGPIAIPPVLKNYSAVTADRLKNPEAANWLMIRRTYDGWGYSPLEEITPANVKRLKPVWVFATGEPR